MYVALLLGKHEFLITCYDKRKQKVTAAGTMWKVCYNYACSSR